MYAGSIVLEYIIGGKKLFNKYENPAGFQGEFNQVVKFDIEEKHMNQFLTALPTVEDAKMVFNKRSQPLHCHDFSLQESEEFF